MARLSTLSDNWRAHQAALNQRGGFLGSVVEAICQQWHEWLRWWWWQRQLNWRTSPITVFSQNFDHHNPISLTRFFFYFFYFMCPSKLWWSPHLHLHFRKSGHIDSVSVPGSFLAIPPIRVSLTWFISVLINPSYSDPSNLRITEPQQKSSIRSVEQPILGW